ncbi:MAG: Kynureninase (L-kynurenine hydrolase) [Piccolia ochrophora]|nr:MAG: Kynureninase (L-kynurenine hydrolase) [Piccolia ochrophora]
MDDRFSHFTKDGETAHSRDYAERLDAEDQLKHFRREFLIPSKADLKRKTLPQRDPSDDDSSSEPSIYLCGNSLGLQPRSTASFIQAHLSAWATKGVYGHFTPHSDSPLSPFLTADEAAVASMAELVGALPGEVAITGTLTNNLHLLMSSFYRPTKDRHKLIIEGRAFPSDHYAAESQIRHHSLSPSASLITIVAPPASVPILSTSHILSTITEHASTTALLLLPGVQYYTGQFLDIATITAHAHGHGILVGWDLAHAAGNVPLRLHEWDVDFAVWCTYKYLNAGPGAIGAMFVHERHGVVGDDKDGEPGYRPRLSGWWGHEKGTRFRMDNAFLPTPGAAGYQLSNPSALDLASLTSSLTIFSRATLPALRRKSILLTSYLEFLLLNPPPGTTQHSRLPYTIITPSSPTERGAQLSIRLDAPASLEHVMRALEEVGVVVDERRPDVVRVAPAPLWNTFREVWEFARVWREIMEGYR